MRKVSAHLSGNAYEVLKQAPGQTDSDRIRWLVDYFGKVLEARAKQITAAKKPKLVAVLGMVGEEIATEPQHIESVRALHGGGAA